MTRPSIGLSAFSIVSTKWPARSRLTSTTARSIAKS